MRDILDSSPGITVIDDPARSVFPTLRAAVGSDRVFVGRIRRDRRFRGLALWVVCDNLRKGAATNAVQIAEILLQAGEKGKS